MADKIRVKSIKARYSAVGNHAKINDKSEIIIMSAEQSALQAEALRQLRAFVDLLPSYAHEIDIERARAAANRVDNALSKQRLRRHKIQRSLKAASTAIGGISALATAISAVEATVHQLMT